MNDDLTSSYEHETGQVILDGRRAGPAGEGRLIPVAGVELAFDLADGHLVQVVVTDDNSPVMSLLTRLLGPRAASVVRAATNPAGAEPAALTPDAVLSARLSPLARLHAARATTPLSGNSPWWDVEAAVLAEQAGLHPQALIAARRAVSALGDHEVAVPAAAARMALAAADILAESDHGAVCRLRDSIVTLVERRQPQPPGLSVAAEVEGLEKNCMRLSGLHWVLDPGLAPGAPFRPGLSPYSDLLVRHEPSAARLVVSATPATGVTRETAEMWHVRLVDPTVRRVLAVAVFEEDGSRAQAQLRLPFPLHELSEAWVEVTDRSDRPVQGVKLHRRRRALRWADAALRAERAPAGLAPGATAADWAALAAAAWEWCYRDWTMADDPERAMAALAPRLPSQDPVCIAEILGE